MKVVVTILVLLVVTTSSATQPQKLRKASFHRDDRRFKSVGQAEVKAYDCSGSILDACAAPAGTETADQLKTLYVTCLNALKQTYANAMSKWQVGNEVGKRDGLNVYTYGDPQKFNNWKSRNRIDSINPITTIFWSSPSLPQQQTIGAELNISSPLETALQQLRNLAANNTCARRPPPRACPRAARASLHQP